MPPPPPQTRHGLLTEAHLVVLPEGIVSSGYPAIARTCEQVRIGLDDWQRDLIRIMSAKTALGLLAADVVATSIARQTGKTHTVGAYVLADSIVTPGTTTVWTAHRFKVARETFNTLAEICRTPDMAPHILSIHTGTGTEEIRFRNGSRLLFAARERGSIRGFANVRRLVLDEAQILTAAAMSDLAPTLNAARDPQIILMGTPPKPGDPGEVFTAYRTDAMAGDLAPGVAYVEISAPRDLDPYSDEAVRLGNPSYPHRTDARAIRRLQAVMASEDDWRREGLGQWDSASVTGAIPRTMWDEQTDEASVAVRNLALGVEVAPDLVSATICLAGQRADGSWHVELEETRSGIAWAVPYLSDLLDKNPGIRAVVTDAGSPSRALDAELAAARIRATQPTVRELGSACSTALSLIVTRGLYHLGQPQLTGAVYVAGKRPLGDTGMWTWARMSAVSDITPVQAMTLALLGAQHPSPVRPRRRSAGGATFA